MKLKRKLIALIMTLIMIVNMSSCLSNDKNEETTPDTTTAQNTTSNGMTESTTNDAILEDPPVPSYAISAQTPDEWEIKNGDISVSLSFGLREGCDTTDYYTNIVFTVGNDEDQYYEFKKIDIEEIEKPEYVVEYVRDNRENVYAHTESILLPLSIFSGDSGTILILMREWVDDGTEDGLFGLGTGVRLYYTRDDTSVFISDKKFVK